MHADLIWLAKNVSEWGGTYGFQNIFLENEKAGYYSNPDSEVYKTFTRDQWQAARNELEDPFSSPEEDEAWKAAEERMDIIGHNGATGEHYQPRSLEDRYPQYYKSVRHLEFVDVYQVHHLFAIEDWSGCIQHASKKLLLSGVRTGGKTKRQDIEEARDTLTRWLEVEQGR